MKESMNPALRELFEDIRVSELAKILGITRQAVYKWLDRGSMPPDRAIQAAMALNKDIRWAAVAAKVDL